MGSSINFTESVEMVQPWYGREKHFLLKNLLDFETTNLANADSAKVFAIKEGWFVKNVYHEIVQVDGTIAFTIGITAGGTEFEGNGAAAAAVGTRGCGIGGTDSGVTAGGILYAADGFLFLDGADVLDTLQLRVVAEIVDTNW